jgi:hypothetical protein
MTIWHIYTAYGIPKATNTQLEYVISIDFSLQQCLHKRTSMLRCSTSTLPFLLLPKLCIKLSSYIAENKVKSI